MTLGPATAIAVLALVIAGAVLFAVHKERPKDFTGYPYLLLPFCGAALLARGNPSAGFAAAALSCVLGYFLAIALLVVRAWTAIA